MELILPQIHHGRIGGGNELMCADKHHVYSQNYLIHALAVTPIALTTSSIVIIFHLAAINNFVTTYFSGTTLNQVSTIM
jgi:hypothetical protein